MKTVIKRYLLFISLLVISCFSLYSLEVYLKKSLVYSHTNLLVSDVAQIRGESPGIIKSLLNIPLNLNTEYLVLLPARYIREIISQNYNSQIIVIGNRVALLNLSIISRKDLYFYNNLLQFIEEIETNKQSRLEIEFFNRSLVLENPAQTEVTFQISGNYFRNGYRVGKNRIFYKYFDKYGSQISGIFDVFIHQYIPVAIPLHDIDAGSLLKKDSISFFDKDISLFNDDLLLSFFENNRYQTRLHLYKGDPIKLTALEQAYLVKAGDKITINFINGSLYVQIQGRALGSGIMDEQVSVKSFSTDKIFNGIVSGHKEVLVEIK